MPASPASDSSSGCSSAFNSPSPPPSWEHARFARAMNNITAHFQAPLRHSALVALDSQARVTYWDVHGRGESHGRWYFVSDDDADDATLLDDNQSEPQQQLAAFQTDPTVYEYFTDLNVPEDMSSSDEMLHDYDSMPLGASPSNSMTSSMEVHLDLSHLGDQFWLADSPGVNYGDFVYIHRPSPTAVYDLEPGQFNGTIVYPDSLIVEDMSDESEFDYDHLDAYNSNDSHDFHYRLYAQMCYNAHYDTNSDSGSDSGAY